MHLPQQLVDEPFLLSITHLVRVEVVKLICSMRSRNFEGFSPQSCHGVQLEPRPWKTVLLRAPHSAVRVFPQKMTSIPCGSSSRIGRPQSRGLPDGAFSAFFLATNVPDETFPHTNPSQPGNSYNLCTRAWPQPAPGSGACHSYRRRSDAGSVPWQSIPWKAAPGCP